MGMGHFANYADTVEQLFVEEVCGLELGAFLGALKTAGVELEHFARDNEYGEGDWGDEVDQAYCELVENFEKATGLTLSVEYHSENDGDRYDDVTGVYWEVSGVYQRTPAGEKYAAKITRAFFVTFG